MGRCPVNHPENRTTKEYRMNYTIEWTRSLTDYKNMRLHAFDLGGDFVKNQNFIDGLSEWNVAPYLNDPALDQRCNATVCNITSSLVVGEQHCLDSGMCAGEMLWSYAHMHSGAIKASMFINGKKHCENVPTVGTDLNNTPGNEAGFLVRMSECVNENKYGNKVRVNKGDVVTIEALYDVDDSSTRYAPFSGGKHGGIMALFFPSFTATQAHGENAMSAATSNALAWARASISISMNHNGTPLKTARRNAAMIHLTS